jgi:cytidine deaminase
MKEEAFQFSYKVYDSINELSPEDAFLLEQAQKVTEEAYVPYSRFRVGAVAKLANGKYTHGSNQENASFPAGLCAERVLLSAASSLYPGIPIDSIAISYRNHQDQSDHPVSPCGICRQSLQEYEQRFKQPIRLILGGAKGRIYVIPKASLLLPLAFSAEEL